MNEKIKRCPFCGGLAITDPSTQNNDTAFMMALMREDDIYKLAQKYLQEAQS